MSKRAVSVLAAALATVGASVLLAVLLGSPNSPSAPLAEVSSTTPSTVVVRLDGQVSLITHDAASGSTSFDLGALEVKMPALPDSFRIIDSAAPASGGRVDPRDVDFSRVPLNLPVVLSYGPAGQRVSIFGRLASAPSVEGSDVVYSISVFDAPGKDATYTVSGSFDIPETLPAPSLSIAGQLLER